MSQKRTSQLEEDQRKCKIRTTCENYAQIKTPYKYKKIIENLFDNKNIIILKQDKGCCVVILNRKIEKCTLKNVAKSWKWDNLENLKQIQQKQLKENYSECFEVLRTCLLKENTNNYFQLVENPVPSMEMLRCITKKR